MRASLAFTALALLVAGIAAYPTSEPGFPEEMVDVAVDRALGAPEAWVQIKQQSRFFLNTIVGAAMKRIGPVLVKYADSFATAMNGKFTCSALGTYVEGKIKSSLVKKAVSQGISYLCPMAKKWLCKNGKTLEAKLSGDVLTAFKKVISTACGSLEAVDMTAEVSDEEFDNTVGLINDVREAANSGDEEAKQLWIEIKNQARDKWLIDIVGMAMKVLGPQLVKYADSLAKAMGGEITCDKLSTWIQSKISNSFVKKAVSMAMTKFCPKIKAYICQVKSSIDAKLSGDVKTAFNKLADKLCGSSMLLVDMSEYQDFTDEQADNLASLISEIRQMGTPSGASGGPCPTGSTKKGCLHLSEQREDSWTE